jgi:hypothetical protein
VPVAHATIQLVLQQTIQLPPGGGMDVQHAVDDHSFAWARLDGDSIRYQLSEEDSVRCLPIPNCSDCERLHSYVNGGVRLLRNVGAGGHVCALVHSWFTCGYYTEELTYNSLSFIDLENGALVDTSVFYAGFSDEMYGRGESITVNQLIPWPPPPRISTRLLCSQSSQYTEEVPMEGRYTQLGGRTWMLWLDEPGFTSDFGEYNYLLPFARSDQLNLVLRGLLAADQHGDPIYSHCSLAAYSPTDEVIPDFLHGCDTPTAQMDADGTRRVIAGGVALDPVTFDVLWQNPDFGYGGYFTARLYGSENERLLVNSNHIFAVYDAADGSFIDLTTVYWGELQYILKPASRTAEVVTFDSQTSTVRVYTFAPPAARHLTIRYIPETQRIRLGWQQAEGAIGHKVYSTDRPSGGDLNLIAELPADSLSYDVQPVAEKRFFFVTDDYEAR